MIFCLTEISDLGRNDEKHHQVAKHLFVQTINSVTSTFSFQKMYPPSKGEESSYWLANFEHYTLYDSRDEWKLVERTAILYCESLLTQHFDEAGSI